MSMSCRIAFAFFLTLFLASAPALPATRPATAQRWVVVSDIHFDPFADPHVAERLIVEPVDRWRTTFAAVGPQPFADYGSDTNDALFESALDAMHSTAGDASVVIVSGDFLAHDFRARFNRIAKAHDDASYASFVDKTEAFLAMEFREAFPRAQLLPAIGNNDSYCGDYASTPSSAFFTHMASYWAPAVTSDANSWMAQFATGGYYAVGLPAGGAQAIVLNDVFWSASYKNLCGDPHADPGGDEVTWLGQMMKAAGTAPVWLIAHLPPGIDAYATLHQAAGGPPVLFLADRFNAAFLSVLASASPPVAMSITAHTHMDSFRIIGPHASTPVTPMLVVPSISPIFGNSPSFTVLDVDSASAGVIDQAVFTLNNLPALAKDGRHAAEWRREYDFDSVYGHGAIDAAHLWSAQQAAFSDERVRRRYESYFDGGSGRAPVTDATWRAYWCSGVALSATDYTACASPTIQTQLPPHPSAPPTPSPTPTPTATPAPTASP